MKVTLGLIYTVEHKLGGFTKNNLAKLGVAWPPSQGWKEKILGKEIPDDAFNLVPQKPHNFFG